MTLDLNDPRELTGLLIPKPPRMLSGGEHSPGAKHKELTGLLTLHYIQGSV